MSLASNTVIGFSSLGAISIASFLLVNSNKQKQALLPPPVQVVKEELPPKELKPEPAPNISEILKSEGYLGCDYLAGQKIKRVLFVCWQQIRVNEVKPSFFYYDKNKISSAKDAKAEHILGITYHNSSSATFRYKEGKSDDLTPPAWMARLSSKGEFDPETVCFFERSNSNSSYNLKCGDRQVQTGIYI